MTDFSGRMEKSMLSIFVGLWITISAVAAKKKPYVPAMFVLGDSLADAGNNNYIPHCPARANFTPYGVSFFPSPTGRFSNGRTAFDFVATYLGLPYPPPYLQPKANFSRGINFASGGSGLLDSTGAESKIIPLSHQVKKFKHYSNILTRKNASGAAQAKSFLGKSLYCITIGANDIGAYITNTTLQNTTTPQHFVRTLLANFNQYMARLYKSGARKFLVFNIPPLGCTPNSRYAGYSIAKGACLDVANQLAVAYNTAFKALVAHLNQKLGVVSIIQLNTFNYFMNILQNPEVYGFKDTTTACCGSGMFNVQVGCGKTKPQMMFCNNTSEHVFWDGTHPTEKVHALFSHQIWTGNSSVMYPFNLSTLVLCNNSSGL